MLRNFALLIAACFSCVFAFPSGVFADLIAVDSTRWLYSIDMTTGAKTSLGRVSSNAGTVGALTYARSSNTTFLSSTDLDSLFTLNLTTGEATLVGGYGDSAIGMHGLEYDESTGTLYGMSYHNSGLYTINQNSGAATLVGTMDLSNSFSNLGYNSDTDVMYVTNSRGKALYTIDRSNGEKSLIGGLSGPGSPNGLAYDWNSQQLFMVDNVSDNLYTIDQSTGAATLIGSTGSGNLLGLMYVNTNATVPEPSSLALAGIGLTCLVLRSRRSRRAISRVWRTRPTPTPPLGR